MAEDPEPEDAEPDAEPEQPRLLERAKGLRDAPLWLGLAPLAILGAALVASALDGVAVTLAVLFVGAALWGVAVWRVTR